MTGEGEAHGRLWGEDRHAEAALVEALVESIRQEPRTRRLGQAPLPDPHKIAAFVEMCRELSFPGFFRRRGISDAGLATFVTEKVAKIRDGAIEQVRLALEHERTLKTCGAPLKSVPASDEAAVRIAESFLVEIPALRRALALDVQAAYDGDPAARHTDETILCYPGLDAVFTYRLANILQRLGAPLIPRIICEQAHSRTGVDIHPGATIGPSFFIDHGAGVVVGETTIIGESVKIYQGVTLGSKSFPKDERGKLIRGQKRHPTIGDRVTIYAGAVILGGDTHVGDDCVINGDVFITSSVPARHIVRQKKPELIMRTNREAADSQ